MQHEQIQGMSGSSSHHQRQRSRPQSGKPQYRAAPAMQVAPPQVVSRQAPGSGYQQPQPQSSNSRPQITSQDANSRTYFTQSTNLIAGDSPMQTRQLAFKNQLNEGSHKGSSRPHVRGSLSQKRSRRESVDKTKRGGHQRRKSYSKTLSSQYEHQFQQDAANKKNNQVVQTQHQLVEQDPMAESNYFHGVLSTSQQPPTQQQPHEQQQQLGGRSAGHLPVQAINNNITVNVNLNVTADDAEQQKKIAQQIVQAATQSIPSQVVQTRQTPFTQFMTDQGLVSQAVATDFQYAAGDQVPSTGSTLLMGSNFASNKHQQMASRKVSKRSSRQLQQQPSVIGISGANVTNLRDSNQHNSRLSSQFQNYQQQNKPKRGVVGRPASAKRTSSGSGAALGASQQHLIQGSTLSNMTSTQLSQLGIHQQVFQKLSVDGLAIEGVKKQPTVQQSQPQKRTIQYQPGFNPDLAYVMDGTASNQARSAVNQSAQPKHRSSGSGKNDLLRSISMTGPSMQSTMNIMDAARISQIGLPTTQQAAASSQIKQEEQKVSIASYNSPASKISALARLQSGTNVEAQQNDAVGPKSPQQNDRLMRTPPRDGSEQSNAFASNGTRPAPTTQVGQDSSATTQNQAQQIQQTQATLMQTFKAQAAPVATSQAALNFKGFSQVGRPVQIKYPTVAASATVDANTSSVSYKQALNTHQAYALQSISQVRHSLSNMRHAESSIQTAPSQLGLATQDPSLLNAKSNGSTIATQVVDPAYQDFQKLLQSELQLQQQDKSAEPYQHQPQQIRQLVQNPTSHNQSQSQSQTKISFNRPGRKVVQRPPSAKQNQKLSSQKNSINHKSTSQYQQQMLSSQSMTLRQRANLAAQNQPKISTQMTPQQQQMHAVRSQKDAMAVFIDKRVQLTGSQEMPLNFKKQGAKHHGKESQGVMGQYYNAAGNGHHLAGVGSHRDFAGLINATGVPHANNEYTHLVMREPQQMPLFIKKTSAPASSHTLVNELKKQHQQLLAASLGPAKQQLFMGERSESALLQRSDRRTASPAQAHGTQDSMNNWRVEYLQVRDSMSAAQQKLVEENITLMTSIRQDQDVLNSAKQKKPLETPTQPGTPIITTSMTLLQKKQSQTGAEAATQHYAQEPKALEKSVSSKTIQQQQQQSFGGEVVYSNSFNNRHQSSRPTAIDQHQSPTTKMKNSKTLQQQAAIVQLQPNGPQYAIMQAALSPNKQNLLVLVVPQQSQSSNANVANVANVAITEGNLESTKKSAMQTIKRPARQARPKSGIPLNRAPFRPSGVAQPSEIISQSRRTNMNRGNEMRKSGTLGRTTSTVGGDKTSGMEETKQRPISSKYDSTVHNFTRKEDAKKKENSYGDSYGSGDDGSYYSDYDDEDEKEQLEYDDQKEYNPGRISPMTKAGTNGGTPQPQQTSPITGTAFVKKPLLSPIANKTIEAKVSTDQTFVGQSGAAGKKQDRYETFGTPEKQGQSRLANPYVSGAKAAIEVSLLEKEQKLLDASDDGDESIGYLDNDEGGEEEADDQKLGGNLGKKILRMSPLPEEKVLLSLHQKSPDVRISKRMIKLRASDGTPTVQGSLERKSGNVGIKPQLGISSSTKVIEKDKTYIDQSEASKKSLQLSDSCPKENLVRKLYQRPGLLANYDGLNSRLRSMSLRKSQEQQDSAASLYQMRLEQRKVSGQSNLQASLTTLEKEMKQNQIKTDNYNAADPYTQSMSVYLVKSPFVGRPPTVFFQYPPGIADVDKKVDRDHIFKMKQNKFKMKYKIAESVHTYNCVVNSLCWNGFSQTDSAGWNMLWSAPLKPETLRNYDMYKHCNHFPGTWQLGRKDLMYRNMSAQIREFGEEYNIVPKTWILPYDLRLFQKEREETSGKNLWILKPAASSCGRGIKILSKYSSIPKRGPYVVNQYIMKPHLLGGFKYDLRLYVLVTSFEPLTIYIYQDGLVRFATQPYTTKNRKSRFAHLTNFSVNKKASNYKKAGQKDEEEENSSKWRLSTLAKAFKAQGLNWDDIWTKIKDLVIKSVISVEPILANNLNRASRNRHLCYEVYGFDVIIDHSMKPWLLEVNVLPSLSSSSHLDKKIKTALMTDVFSTIGMVPYNKKKFERTQESNYWNRFSGLTKGGHSGATESAKKPRKQQDEGKGGKSSSAYHQDGQQQYFGLYEEQIAQDRDGKGSKAKNSGDMLKNYGNVEPKQTEDDEDSSEGENIAWTQTQNNMAQSQSNYIQTKIRSVKELMQTYDFNVEEQLVIVELLEEYCRRGNFEMIFPRKKIIEKYRKYFKVQRACNTIVWKWLKLSSTALGGANAANEKKGTKAATLKHSESRNLHDAHSTGNHGSAGGPRSRFTVLKDFKIRGNCASHFIEDIKHI